MSGAIQEPRLKVFDNVSVRVNRFVEDPNGDVIGQDGRKGFYVLEPEMKAHNLLTTAGRDWLHQQGYKTTGLTTNGANWIGLTTDAGAPATGDTTLASEITQYGLERAVGSVAHTNGQTTTTVAKTFTASSSFTAVQKSALFINTGAVTMVHEATFSSVNLANNDQLTVTWTITLS